MKNCLKDKTVVITGASSGIGEAMAREYAASVTSATGTIGENVTIVDAGYIKNVNIGPLLSRSRAPDGLKTARYAPQISRPCISATA